MNKTTTYQLEKSFTANYTLNGKNITETVIAATAGKAIFKIRKKGVNGTIAIQ